MRRASVTTGDALGLSTPGAMTVAGGGADDGAVYFFTGGEAFATDLAAGFCDFEGALDAALGAGEPL
jgi:hypothetical protein